MQKAIAERYPLTYLLEDGAKVTFSLMSKSDQEALSKFIEGLAKNDLHYLQVDITQPDIQQRWFESIEQGKSVCLCAYDAKGLVGYASVQVSGQVGEIRVNIVQGYRSRGLGRGLIDEIIKIARQTDLHVVKARMLSDQYGAKAAFKRLGFENEQVLEGYVEDSPGKSKDLLVMATTLH